MDQEVHKESKYPRHFRTALISLVKELLKPAWREGHLSKDAHNTIVRKSSEKVLSTMQPHQVPTTPESIKHYLQSSRPKLEKLIEVSLSRV
ncbi:Zinc finger CCCH domain-containing protein 38 [Linum grandiflorum]